MHGAATALSTPLMKRISFFFSLLLCCVLLGSLNSCVVRMPTAPKTTRASVQQPAVNKTVVRQAARGNVSVYLIADSLHTSIAVPYDWLLERGYKAPEALVFPQGNSRYIVMSWGDRVAYLQKGWLRPWEIINALFLPSASVTEIIPISWNVQDVCYRQRIYRAEISAKKGRALASFLNHSNVMNSRGFPSIIAASTWGNGYLLDCKYSYYFPRICNVWTGQTLEACGLSINMRSAIGANGLIRQAEKQGFTLIHEGDVKTKYGRAQADD